MGLVRRLCLAAVVAATCGTPATAQAPEPKAVLGTYVAIARAMYDDAAQGTRDLKKSIDAFLANPTEDTLKAAREAWLKARVPYQQTEGFRFGNKAVDELEGKVNAWPLDEGLIDYVDTSSYGESSDDNPLFRANIIANKRIRVGRNQIDASKIDKKLLERLHEAGGVEANVATGYHAIEFLLWGQDLNGTGPGAGKRPATDYSLKACTN